MRTVVVQKSSPLYHLPCAPTTVAIVALKIFPAPREPEAGLEGRSLEQRRCAEDIVLSTEGDKNPPCSFGKLNVNKNSSLSLRESQKYKSHFLGDPCIETGGVENIIMCCGKFKRPVHRGGSC